jgi:hypothetical protein
VSFSPSSTTEIIRHSRIREARQTGLVIEPGGPETPGRARLELLRDPAKASEMDRNRRWWSVKGMVGDVIAGRYLEELKKSLEGS